MIDGAFRADAALRLAVRLVEAGATVRRLAPGTEIPFWFGSQTALVCRPCARLRVLGEYPEFPQTQILVQDEIPSDEQRIGRLLQGIDAALPGWQGLRLASPRQD